MTNNFSKTSDETTQVHPTSGIHLHCDWGFPFPPYSIQSELMSALYETLHHKGIGIFESPTGTGKSLSLICGALTWMNDNVFNPDVYTNLSEASATESGGHDDGAPDWVRHQAIQNDRDTKIDQIKQYQRALQNRIDHVRRLPRVHSIHRPPTKKQNRSPNPDDEASDFLLEYESDGPSEPVSVEEDDTLPQYSPPQIIYVSRTHSQLTQFIREFSKTKFASQTTPVVYSVVSVASRHHLCINQDVLKASGTSASQVNDRCRDLQQTNKGCPYLTSAQVNAFATHVLATPMNIEDLVDLGHAISACPYYGARKAVPMAHLVVMPYTSLVSHDVRHSTHLRVRGNIVVIDEAHNVMDAINNAHGTHVDGIAIERAHNGLVLYLARYCNLLKPSNRVLIQQLVQLLLAIHQWLIVQDSEMPGLMQTSEFVFHLNVDQLNLFKLAAFLRDSQLGRKVLGFMDHVASNDAPKTTGNGPGHQSCSTTLFTDFERFLNKLVYPDHDGRILFHVPPDLSVPVLQYFSLNPGSHFAELVSDAHAIILAGGTLQPISDYTEFLMPNQFGKPIITKSFGHVVPKHHVKTLIVTKSPAGRRLLCTMEGRKDPTLLNEIASTIANLVNIVPRGLVVFFPSFSMLNETVRKMEDNGTMDRIGRKKKVYIEPRVAQALEQMLGNYARHLDEKDTNGAMLLAVVNGKMSEGINFSDHLARCVMMIGLPYPNRSSMELNERLKYIETQRPGGSSEYYENLCMRAVNQSIGRAIRHANDHAAIVLVDTRYESVRIRSKLPAWITEDVGSGDRPFGHIIRDLAQFYRELRPAT